MKFRTLMGVFVGAWLALSSHIDMAQASSAEYMKKTSKLNALESRIRTADEQIRHLIDAKNRSSDSNKKREIINEMVSTHKKMKEDIKEYNHLRVDVEYRFPNKGEVLKRRYHPIGERSLEEIEKGTGLDQVLSAAKSKIDKKYKAFKKKKETPTGLPVDRPKREVSSEEEPKRLRLVK